MRPVLYFILTCVAVAVLTLTSLPTEALPVRDPESLDARGQEYQEQIRKERHETARRFYEYIKTLARPDWLFLIRPDGPRQT